MKCLQSAIVIRGIRLLLIAVLCQIILGNGSVSAQISDFCTSVTEIPEEECEALVSLHEATNGSGWSTTDGWLVTGTPPCSWHGVGCNAGHVEHLMLGSNNLTGVLPTGLDALSQLQQLWLPDNAIGGAIPSDLGNFPHLVGLSLADNEFAGSIPPELGDLSSLAWYLRLTNNQLTGPIPPQLGTITTLALLDLSGNRLNGSIPPELGNMTALEFLYLGGNELSGSLQFQTGDFPALLGMYLSHNQFSGNLPQLLGYLPNLHELDVSHNPLIGPLPASMTNLWLTYFAFNDTDLCEPTDVSFQAWLASIDVLESTNLSCLEQVSCEKSGSNMKISWSHMIGGVDHHEVYRGTCFSCPTGDPSFTKQEPDIPPPATGNPVEFIDSTAFNHPLNNYSYFIYAIAVDDSRIGLCPSYLGSFNFDITSGEP